VGLPIEAKADAFGGRSFTGEITGIDSRVDPVTRSVKVRAVLPNKDGVLKSGILMTLEVLKSRRKAAVIPEQAVITRKRETRVFVVDTKDKSRKAQSRMVELGTRLDGNVEVVSGLDVGELVVVDGTLRVRDGQAVEVTAIDKGGEPLADLLNRKRANGT